MHPTDRCHPNERTCTRTSRVPGSLERLRAREVPRALGPVGHDRGRGRFTAPRHRFGGPSRDACSPSSPRREASGRGRLRPTAPVKTEPLTPLSLLCFPRAPGAFAFGSRLTSRWGGSRGAELPRSPGRTARERDPLSVTRGAFRRQGALRGIRWQSLSRERGYPGPATRPPLARCSDR